MGIGGLLVIIIVKELLDRLAKKKSEDGVSSSSDKIKQIDRTLQKMDERVQRTEHLVDDLHKWHDVADADGVRIWYNRRSLEEAIKSLAENVGVQTQILTSLVNEIKDSRRDISGLEKEMTGMKEK